jgi:hypothetical protein
MFPIIRTRTNRQLNTAIQSCTTVLSPSAAGA